MSEGETSPNNLPALGKHSGPKIMPQDGGTIRGAIHRFLQSEKKNSPMLFWALVVGILAGGVGGIFRICLEKITEWRLDLVHWARNEAILSWLLPTLLTAVMLYISIYLVRKYAPETSGSGVQEMEGALDGLRPIWWKRVLPVKFFAGLFSLGGGLVLGREGPTIQMGGSLGQMISEFFKCSKEDNYTLIAAGAGAGLAAAFNAPLAGILFVIEEMRPQFKYSFISVQAVMIASAAADIMVRALTSQAPVIPMPIFTQPDLTSLWVFVIFGALFGIFGFFFNNFLIRMLNFFSKMRGWPYLLTGLYVGAFLGFLGWLFPGAIGGGYQVIPHALEHHFTTYGLLFLFLARYGTTIISYGSGAPGGIFAPMLALGTLFGLWFGNITEVLLPGLVDRPGVFAVAGMGALFSATVRAPLTGIALAIEMTGNYSQILPLIITCMSATLVAQGLGGKPIYTVLLQRTLAMVKGVAQAMEKKSG